MDWLAQNWIWVLFGIAFVAMHLFGHGGHGGHGGHRSAHSGRPGASDAQAAESAGIRSAAPPSGNTLHRH